MDPEALRHARECPEILDTTHAGHVAGAIACTAGYIAGATFHAYNEIQYLDLGCTRPATLNPTTSSPTQSPATFSPTTSVPTGVTVPSSFQAYACGSNSHGAFGTGTQSLSPNPAATAIVPNLAVSQVAAGDDHALFLTTGETPASCAARPSTSAPHSARHLV
ncbi:hypothetical protein CYMTET_51539 [Cymbomonas tetramitiformis]|uniref:Uncharacterized protein n=1 Tax=Cymbomonas tetramitiformis TaxID=36881 RepID=A0AAE0BM26_9CHLO|nr:hypothetical protein CYMTET_51539 [Cymbomonas tetramitiformis]